MVNNNLARIMQLNSAAAMVAQMQPANFEIATDADTFPLFQTVEAKLRAALNALDASLANPVAPAAPTATAARTIAQSQAQQKPALT
jgi:hypothetical protein